MNEPSNTPDPSASAPLTVVWKLMLPLAVVISFVMALQWWLIGLQPLWIGFLAELPMWLTWAALTPLVFRAGEQWPLAGPLWFGRLVLHIGLALLAAAVVLAPGVVTRMALGYEPNGFLVEWWQALRGTFALWTLIYFGLLGLHHSVRYRNRLLIETAGHLLKEAEVSRLRLQMVQAQLHPHFLYNALNTVSSLVGRDPKAARAVVSRLSELLRTVVQRSGFEWITLEEEMEFAGTYLDIQRYRFRDQLVFAVDCDPETRRALVPPMILQPVIENSLKHAVPSDGRAVISVRSDMVEGKLRLEVQDNGPGFGGYTRDGQGLRWVKLMLSRIRGADIAFRTCDAPGSGGLVVIEMPFHPAPADMEDLVEGGDADQLHDRG